MKKTISIILSLFLILSMSGMSAISVFAATDNSQNYNFIVTANGGTTANVAVGDEVTIQLVLKASSPTYQMYALQDEFIYDTEYLQFVDGSETLANSQFISSGGNAYKGTKQREILSYLSWTLEGETFNDNLVVGSFRLKVVKAGTSTVESINYKMVAYDAHDVYASTSNNVTITTNGGSITTGGAVTTGSGVTTGGSVSGGSGGGGGGGGSSTSAATGSAITGSGINTTGGSIAGDNADNSNNDAPADNTTSGNSAESFTDISGHWAESYIKSVVGNGLFTGISSTTFSPDSNMTRAMLVTVLWRLEGQPGSLSENSFADVKAGSYYFNAVKWAAENEIVKGFSISEFRPDENVTREQMAAIFYRYAQFKGYDVSATADISSYSDYSSISSYALVNMSWANGAGLISGRTASTLVPKGNATRAEVAAILQRFMDNVI